MKSRKAAIVAVAFLLGILTQVSTLPANAQTTSTVALSNINQDNGGTVHTNSGFFAQSFKTGSVSGGYSLASIALVLGVSPTSAQRSQIRVELHSNRGSGINSRPKAKLFNFNVPAHPISAGIVTFTAPASTTLDADTRYWVIPYTIGDQTTGNAFNMKLARAAWQHEDSRSAANWNFGHWAESLTHLLTYPRNPALVTSPPTEPQTGSKHRSSAFWDITSACGPQVNYRMKMRVNLTSATAVTSANAHLNSFEMELSTDGTNFGTSVAPHQQSGHSQLYAIRVEGKYSYVRMSLNFAGSGATAKVWRTGRRSNWCNVVMTPASGAANHTVPVWRNDINRINVEVSHVDGSTVRVRRYSFSVSREDLSSTASLGPVNDESTDETSTDETSKDETSTDGATPKETTPDSLQPTDNQPDNNPPPQNPQPKSPRSYNPPQQNPPPVVIQGTSESAVDDDDARSDESDEDGDSQPDGSEEGDSQPTTSGDEKSGQPDAQSQLSGAAGTYDVNGDGKIDLAELGKALKDFAAGKITVAEIVEVLRTYLS